MDEIWCTGRSIIILNESADDEVFETILPQNIMTCKRCPNKQGC